MNVIAGVVYALAMPFVALTTTYVYFDARSRTSSRESLRPACSLPRSLPTDRRTATT